MDNRFVVNRVWVVKIVRCITEALRQPSAIMEPAGAETEDHLIRSECLPSSIKGERIAGDAREELGLTGYICQLLWCQTPVEGVLAEHDHALHKHAKHVSDISHITAKTVPLWLH